MTGTHTPTFPLCFLSRLRMAIDGKGVTTLVGAYGCPLRCNYCLNPKSWKEDTSFTSITPLELYEKVKIDHLYFLATGGGVTFGGGEPLVHGEFLMAFREICPQEWHLTAETSLHISETNLRYAMAAINDFIIDIKDMNPLIYQRYTGRDNAIVKQNLSRLLERIPPERIKIRVPSIPNFNTQEDVDASVRELEDMGFVMFDKFTYRTDRT